MANLTYYSANRTNDFLLGGTSFTQPATYYLGLSTTATQKDGTGITEPTDGAYERISITNNKVNFGTSALGSLTNLIEFSFSESTADWGVITHWFLSDSSVGGNIWFQGTLTSSRNVESETVLILPVGSFSNLVE